MILIRSTRVKPDYGSIVHFIFGVLAVLLNQIPVFTAIFLFKQAVDLVTGEHGDEVSGDVAEYSAGLILMLLCGVFL
ncbi:MAG: hypothetical protein QW334_00410 [Thermofilum sp.]